MTGARLARVAVAVAAAALLGSACGGGGGGGEATDTVSMVDNAFEPSEFTAASETITATNEGQAVHSFTVPEGDVDQIVQPGQSADIDLSGLDAGSYDLECTFHPEMTGSITVE